MMWCGYSTKDREIVANRIIEKQKNDRISNQIEGRPIHRSKNERKEQIKKDKSTWFREMGATTTLVVPMSQNSRLAKNLREVIRKYPGPIVTSVKVVEKPGSKILAGIAVNDPFKNTDCNKENCPLQNVGCRGYCSKKNIIYRATCNICHNRQTDNDVDENKIVHRQYLGESA